MALPYLRPFYVHLKHVRYEEHPQVAATHSPPEFYWQPSPAGSFHTQDASGWWKWDPGTRWFVNGLEFMRPAEAGEMMGSRRYKSSTMIWAPERQSYIHIPIDCTTTNPTSEAHTWQRLSFRRVEHSEEGTIALIGHQRETKSLPVQGQPYWFQALLPDAYQCQVDNGERCGLAGELSILAGLVAFSAVPQLAIQALNRSFRPNTRTATWTPHDLEICPSESWPYHREEWHLKLIDSYRMVVASDGHRDPLRSYRSSRSRTPSMGEG